MNAAFDLKQLFGNEHNSVLMLDYKRILRLLREYIECTEVCIAELPDSKTETYEHVCKLFAESIVDYAKAVYDNMIIGQVKASNILNRNIIESYVCLKAIMVYKDEELWKYWLVQSFYDSVKKYSSAKNTERMMQHLEDMYQRLDVDPSFLTDKKKRRGDYRWAWKISHKDTFKGICTKVFPRAYEDDYKMMCEFSHGTSFFQKAFSYTLDTSIMNAFSITYLYLYLLINECFPGLIDADWMECDLKLGKMFNTWLKDFE